MLSSIFSRFFMIFGLLWATSPLLANNIIVTIAGNGIPGFSGDGDSATAAALHRPSSLFVDTKENVYIADSFNHCIRLINTRGMISTVAGNGVAGYKGDFGSASSAQLNTPLAVFLDKMGNIYIADTQNHCIRKVDAQGTISTIAGTGTAGFSGDNGPAIFAQLNTPCGLFVDSNGALYITDGANQRIRKVDASGTISTIAGTGIAGFSGDNGLAISAEIRITPGEYNIPAGIFADTKGNIFFADRLNNRVRKIDASGIISTVAGTGFNGLRGDGGLAINAELNNPSSVFVDPQGNLHIADSYKSRVRKVNTAGIITTTVGTGQAGFSGDGGPAVSAKLNFPFGIFLNSLGDIYVADSLNNRIRKDPPSTSGMQTFIQTSAGIGTSPGYSGDGGDPTLAKLDTPYGVTVDPYTATYYIADTANDVIRKVAFSGSGFTITTIAGNGTPGYSGDGGSATTAQLNGPRGVCIDAALGEIYIADTGNNCIRKVTSAGVISTFAGDGTGTAGNTGDGGSPTAAGVLFNAPEGVCIDLLNALYIADTGNNRIRLVNLNVLSNYAGNSAGTSGSTGDGALATAAFLNGPKGVGVPFNPIGNFNLYIADTGNNRVRYVDTTTLDINGLAGTGTAGFSGDDGLATSAQLNMPAGVSVPYTEGLTTLVYIADTANSVIRSVDISTGIITTIAGTPQSPGFSGDGGLATSAQLNNPAGIVAQLPNIFYIADTNNDAIRSAYEAPSPPPPPPPGSFPFAG